MTKTQSHSGECRCNSKAPPPGLTWGRGRPVSANCPVSCRANFAKCAGQPSPVQAAQPSPAQPAQPSPVRQCELANFHKT